MSAKAELLLRALCLCVRGLTTGQTMRLLGVRDEANYRRFLRPLVAVGLVNVVRALAKPVPEMREPLFLYGPKAGPLRDEQGHTNQLFSHVLYRAWKRWAGVPAGPTTCVVATRKAGQLYGVPRNGQLAQPLQATHDLAVAEVFITMLKREFQIENREVIKVWRGEDTLKIRLNGKLPDAVLVNAENVAEEVIEIVGADYTALKLLAIRNECHRQRLNYQLW